MIKSRSSLPIALQAFCVLPLFFAATCVLAQDASTPASPAVDASQSRSLPVLSNTVLRYNDVVKITVYGEDDLTTEARIEKDGTIRFPLLGTVELAGKTVEQATSTIRSRLAEKYIRNPQVNLSISSHAILRLTVLGEVKKPGEVEFPEDASLDFLGAIALAGGFGELAEISHITVKRTINGKVEILQVDARKLAHDSNTKPFYVQPGDTITVRQRIF